MQEKCICGQLARSGQRDCLDCHALAMRTWRATHELSDLERKKMNARAYAHVYLKRGRLERKPCVVCGNGASQMHHTDYDKPLEVTWLCRWHHLELHSLVSANSP